MNIKNTLLLATAITMLSALTIAAAFNPSVPAPQNNGVSIRFSKNRTTLNIEPARHSAALFEGGITAEARAANADKIKQRHPAHDNAIRIYPTPTGNPPRYRNAYSQEQQRERRTPYTLISDLGTERHTSHTYLTQESAAEYSYSPSGIRQKDRTAYQRSRTPARQTRASAASAPYRSQGAYGGINTTLPADVDFGQTPFAEEVRIPESSFPDDPHLPGSAPLEDDVTPLLACMIALSAIYLLRRKINIPHRQSHHS